MVILYSDATYKIYITHVVVQGSSPTVNANPFVCYGRCDPNCPPSQSLCPSFSFSFCFSPPLLFLCLSFYPFIYLSPFPLSPSLLLYLPLSLPPSVSFYTPLPIFPSSPPYPSVHRSPQEPSPILNTHATPLQPPPNHLPHLAPPQSTC